MTVPKEKQLPPEIEKAWDEAELDMGHRGDMWNVKKSIQVRPSEVKAFIAQSLSQRDRELWEKLEGMKDQKHPFSGLPTRLYRNEVIEDIQKLLNQKDV